MASEILILDEPTAVLTPNETKDLFGNLRKLREAGRTIVFISHKLDEVMEIADRITVLRRGRVVGETRPADTSKAKLAEMMVGRPVLFRLEKPKVEIGEPVLRVDGLTGEGKLNGIDLEVRAGEILGVAGVEGNGQRELAETLFGLRTPASGTIELEGASITGRPVGDIRNAGVGYIPEDRHDQGLVLNMTLWENAVLGRQDDEEFSGSLGVLFIKKIKELAVRLVQLFDIRDAQRRRQRLHAVGWQPAEADPRAGARDRPEALIAAQPTRGLDVGAIEFVWKQILDQKAAGRAVLLISAELDEIYALSDRIVTLYEGKITGEFAPDAPPEEIGVGMLGGAKEPVP